MGPGRWPLRTAAVARAGGGGGAFNREGAQVCHGGQLNFVGRGAQNTAEADDGAAVRRQSALDGPTDGGWAGRSSMKRTSATQRVRACGAILCKLSFTKGGGLAVEQRREGGREVPTPTSVFRSKRPSMCIAMTDSTRMVNRELSRVCWLRRDQHNRQWGDSTPCVTFRRVVAPLRDPR